MRKLLSIAIVIAMLLSIAVPAFAADDPYYREDPGPGQTRLEITAPTNVWTARAPLDSRIPTDGDGSTFQMIPYPFADYEEQADLLQINYVYSGATAFGGLTMENVGAHGFGTVPKLVMLDTRLTAQAKAIYAYFASFAGAGTAAFPRRSTITRDLSLSPAAYYSHFNLLLDCGYLTVEHRKSGGRFDVSLYRLTESVDAPPLPPPRKGNRKAMSEKPAHGKNGDTIGKYEDKGESETPMSEKQVHGELLKTGAALSEKVMSEKPMSEITAHGKIGHANINNNSITNNSFEKEQEYYHQGCAPDDKKPVPLFSLEQAKGIMRYDDLRCNALAWGELKAKLGHFSTPKDQARYMRKIAEILDETARQAHSRLNTDRDSQRVAAVLKSEAFTAFIDEILDRWDEIRSPKGYVAASFTALYVHDTNSHD